MSKVPQGMCLPLMEGRISPQLGTAEIYNVIQRLVFGNGCLYCQRKDKIIGNTKESGDESKSVQTKMMVYWIITSTINTLAMATAAQCYTVSDSYIHTDMQLSRSIMASYCNMHWWTQDNRIAWVTAWDEQITKFANILNCLSFDRRIGWYTSRKRWCSPPQGI